jgi:selenocysteine lyase/cysteine desulfurase
MLDRRGFLVNTAGLAGVLALQNNLLPALAPFPPLPDRALYDRKEQSYWAELRKQFLIPSDEVYLNNGTAGSSPLPVLRAIFDSYNEWEKMARPLDDYPVWGYGPWNEFRDPLADFVGASRDEIALLRNCTEANNYIANGIDLKAGDEVLISDQDFLGEQAWNLRSKRYGIVVKKFQLAKPPKNAAEILNGINDAITPRTRVLFFSHITMVTGLVLPAKEICSLARSKGIISAVDGAHVIGMMKLNLHDLGCDLYASSPHKWLMATKGTGFLYVRDEMIDRLWSTTATEGWDDSSLRAERFQRIGSSNVPSLYGLRAAIEFANQIGIDRIEKRHRTLCDYVHGEMVKRGCESWTSPDPKLRCGMAKLILPTIDVKELQRWMWERHKVKILGSDSRGLRLSTPYYVQFEDLDRFLGKFDEYRRVKNGA